VPGAESATGERLVFMRPKFLSMFILLPALLALTAGDAFGQC
jgi:hypothetical protein